jgi:single-strand DNA-binding protein
MVQTNLFPHQEVRNSKQPQRAASKAQTAQPSTNANRQTGVPQNNAAHSQSPTQFPQDRNRKTAAYAGPRTQAQPSYSIRLSGRIGRYFEVKQTRTGKSLATFSLATQKPYRDESGNWLKRTVWQRIVAWGDTAQSLSQQLRQGARVAVEGKFKTREWTDREDNLRTTTELVARHVQFMDMAEA